MSNIRYLQSQCDRAFREDYSRRFPGFEKPQIVPAATIRQGLGVTYLSRYIDQDPNSFYMFIQGNPMNGDVSRDAACRLFEDFFYDKMHMPSSFDIEAGGEYSREQAIDKEVLPARADSAYRTYYDEQMERLRAMEQEPENRPEETPEQSDDVIDVELGDDGSYQASSATRSVQTTAGTAVGRPKKIFYAVDFHIPAGGGMLGYNRGENRLSGRRRPGGYLREAEAGVKPITGKEFVKALKDAAGDAKFASFRMFDEKGESNLFNPIEVKYDFGVGGQSFKVGDTTRKPVAQSVKFEDHFMWALKHFCKENGKNLTQLIGGCKEVCLEDGKTKLPVVKAETGVNQDGVREFVMYVKPAEDAASAGDDLDWLGECEETDECDRCGDDSCKAGEKCGHNPAKRLADEFPSVADADEIARMMAASGNIVDEEDGEEDGEEQFDESTVAAWNVLGRSL